jgi:outer membrane lipoprotein SlyB
MDTVDTMKTASPLEKRTGILYPVMLIAAIAVIVLSVMGIATMMGWIPGALSGSDPAAAKASCVSCGVVESIRVVEMQGEPSGLGAVTGGVAGDPQVGRGGGRAAATVVGAGAGAYAGNEFEKRSRKSVRYQIGVRMNDGSSRTSVQNTLPELSIGQKVRVTDQGVVAAS